MSPKKRTSDFVILGWEIRGVDVDWSKVKKEHVDQAIKKFIEDKPEHPEPRSYYLLIAKLFEYES